MIGIYAIRNTKNGKMYIGESIDIEQRWKVHQEDLDNGTHHSYKLQNEWDRNQYNQFRFFVLEEFIFPFNAKLDETKLQLILYCREYYYMKKYKSKSQGYNVEATLKAIIKSDSKYSKYAQYQTKDCKQFIINNKDVLTTDKFNLNVLLELCLYNENNKLGEAVYINANSSPQRFNPYITAYTCKKSSLIYRDINEICNKKEPKEKSKTNKVEKDINLVPRPRIFSHLDDEFTSKYSLNVLYYIDMQDGFIKFEMKNGKRYYTLTDKGIESNYFTYGDIHTNGYTKNQILVTQLGIERYKKIISHIADYLSLDILQYSKYDKFYVPDNIYDKFKE